MSLHHFRISSLLQACPHFLFSAMFINAAYVLIASFICYCRNSKLCYLTDSLGSLCGQGTGCDVNSNVPVPSVVVLLQSQV